MFQGSFKDDLRNFQGSLKIVSSVFQEDFIISFKGILRVFQGSFVLQFCCCMNIIAATRAEGGLRSKGIKISNFPKYKRVQILFGGIEKYYGLFPLSVKIFMKASQRKFFDTSSQSTP